jgi:PadR family transcriptional regulator PadR
MTDSGLQFYSELERTWKELADAVQTLTSTDGSLILPDEIPNNNQIN